MIRKLQELEVIVRGIVIDEDKAIIKFSSGKSKYSLTMSKEKSDIFRINKKYTAFMDYKIPFVNFKELGENSGDNSYSEALKKFNEIVKVKRYIHSIREGNRNFIYL